MDNITLSLSDPFTRGLACAALHRGLRSVLVFDPSLPNLQAVAHTWGQMLTTVTDKRVEIVTLAPTVTDDDLWGSLTLDGDDLSITEGNELTITWQKGLLGKSQDDESIQLVVVPDLTRLSLAAARACVVLVGASVAHLERHGQQARWQPNICWLAGCARAEIGQVSPHLLDRFALWLQEAKMPQPDRVGALIGWLGAKSPVAGGHIPSSPLPDALWQQLQQARREPPAVTFQAIKRVLDYVPVVPHIGSRFEVALTRLAQSNAQLEGAAQVEVQHIDAVAQLIGLEPIHPEVPTPTGDELETPQPEVDSSQPEPLPETSLSSSPPETTETITTIEEEVLDPGTPEVSKPVELPLDTHPWPWDNTMVEREVDSLRVPWRRYQATMEGRGPAIGVQRADSLHDLAIVSTIFEAAKFQAIRRKYNPDDPRSFLLRPTDLRRYRRIPIPEQMLALVLDYTCFRNINWQDALLPYLRWAYVERASICLIQVGTATAKNELRAERVMAHSILSPQISRAMEINPGRATPLAHGFDLARQTLKTALQYGRHSVKRVHLVVLTDGRGNIPLEASRTGKLKAPVNREGIEDAIHVAQSLEGLKHLQITVLDPQARQHAELPTMLGEALGAVKVPIPRLEEVLA